MKFLFDSQENFFSRKIAGFHRFLDQGSRAIFRNGPTESVWSVSLEQPSRLKPTLDFSNPQDFEFLT
jgi:hypothetical protein